MVTAWLATGELAGCTKLIAKTAWAIEQEAVEPTARKLCGSNFDEPACNKNRSPRVVGPQVSAGPCLPACSPYQNPRCSSTGGHFLGSSAAGGASISQFPVQELSGPALRTLSDITISVQQSIQPARGLTRADRSSVLHSTCIFCVRERSRSQMPSNTSPYRRRRSPATRNRQFPQFHRQDGSRPQSRPSPAFFSIFPSSGSSKCKGQATRRLAKTKYLRSNGREKGTRRERNS